MLFKKNYPELDLLRAIAITLVMLVHFKQQTFSLPGNSYFSKFFDWGLHGVDLFFVLSGFPIGGQLIERIRTRTFSFKEFYVKRFFRIAPAYYLALLVFVLFYSIGSNTFILRDERILNAFIIHIFYLQNYTQAVILRGLYWTLAVEEQFYILIPALLFILHGRKKVRLAGFLILFILVGFALKFILYDPSKDWSVYFYQPLHMRFDSLLLGVLSALAFITYRDKLRENVLIYKVVLYSVAAVCLALTFFYGSFGHGYFNTTWQFILSGIGFSALILAAAAFSKQNMHFHWLFKPIATFSYAMYLYHTMIKTIFINYLVKFFSVNNTLITNYLITFAAYFAVVFVLCGIHYFLIENPCLKYRKKLISRMQD